MTLRDYQRRFVRDVQSAFRAPLDDGSACRAVIGQMPTGAGKSASAIEGFIVPSVERGHRVIFFADLGEILDDAAARIAQTGVRVGIVRAGHRCESEAQVYVASLQTCARRLDALPEASRVIVDECHGSEAPTVKAVLARYPGALMLGLTATPARGDGAPLAEFQRLVCGPSMRSLIDGGSLVEPVVFAPGSVLEQGVARDPVEVIAENPGRRFVVFAPNAAEAERIARDASAMGHATAAVLDGMDREERRSVRARIASGDLRSVVSVRALVKGFDATELDAVILTTTGSVTTYLQSVGRGLRAHPGKIECLVWDLRGAVHLHGLPDDDRAWSLAGAQGRSVTERPAGLRRCAECHAVFAPAVKCPRCGSARVTDPRPMRVQRSELFNASTMPAEEREKRYREGIARRLVTMGKPQRVAERIAAKAALPWARTIANERTGT